MTGPLVAYTQYFCSSCGEECINHWELARTRFRECKKCHSIPVLDRGQPVDKLQPGLRWAVHAQLHDLDLSPDSADLEDTSSDSPSGGPNDSGSPSREAGRTPQRDRRRARKPGSPERPEAASPAARNDGSPVESPSLWASDE